MSKTIVTGVVAVVAIVFGSVVAVVVSNHDPATVLSLVTIVVGPTIAALVSVHQGEKNSKDIQATKEMVNGHLTDHVAANATLVEAATAAGDAVINTPEVQKVISEVTTPTPEIPNTPPAPNGN